MIAWAVASTLVGLSMQPPESAGFELQWEAPEGCPAAEDVTSAIGEVLDDDGALGRTSVRAKAQIAARNDGFAMTLQIGEGSRELFAASCDEVAATSAFLVAIAIDPRVLGQPMPTIVTKAEPTREPEPPPPEVFAPPIEAPPAPATKNPRVDEAPPPEPRPGIAVSGRVVAGIGFGPSPRTTGAFAASVGIVHRFFRVEIEGQYWIPRRLASSENRDVAVIAQLWTVGARGCGVVAGSSIEIPICALAQAGLIHAKGDGDLRSQRARVPWVGVGGGVMVIGWLTERIGFGAGFDVLGSVVSGGFRSDPSGDIDRVGPVAVTALAGFWWRTAWPGSMRSGARAGIAASRTTW